MKRISILFLLLAAISSQVLSQEINKKYFDKRAGAEVLIDQCDRSGLEEGSFGEIYASLYEEYLPDETIINKLKDQIEGITITMVFGSWCFDSKMQVPPFMKVLDEIGFNEEFLTIIGVDRLKKTQDYDIDGLKIRFVPTFIIYRDDIELGRIVENPKNSLEQDLLEILQ